MTEGIDQGNKVVHKTDFGDVAAWLLIGYFGVGLVWGLIDVFLLGGFQKLSELVQIEGSDHELEVLGYVIIDLLPAIAGIYACSFLKNKHKEGELTSAATGLLCVAVLIFAGFIKGEWEVVAASALLLGGDSTLDHLVVTACQAAVALIIVLILSAIVEILSAIWECGLKPGLLGAWERMLDAYRQKMQK